MANILVVDDELGIRDLLFEILDDEGHQVELAENAAQARAARQRQAPDLVLLDIWMPDTDGVTLLKEWAGQGLPPLTPRWRPRVLVPWHFWKNPLPYKSCSWR
jgi:DNA-binding NtrC family response regulator